MKVTVKYTFPDDKNDFRLDMKAKDLALSLWDISQYLRNVEKYENGDDIATIRENFYTILSDYDINLDNLIE